MTKNKLENKLNKKRYRAGDRLNHQYIFCNEKVMQKTFFFTHLHEESKKTFVNKS